MLDKRIEYYVRKVVQFGSVSNNKKRNKYRHKRLLLYKELLYKRIGERGYLDGHASVYNKSREIQ